jgi:hypothetical protein
MYATVTWEKLLVGGSGPLSDAAKAPDAPTASQAPGLISYYVVDLGQQVFATIAIFVDKPHADQWAAACRDYADRNNLRQHFDESIGPPRGFAGNVVYNKGSEPEGNSRRDE